MDDQETSTAIHEAGNAVAFVRLFPDLVCDSVSIEPEEDTLGRHFGEEMSLPFDSPDERAESYFNNVAVHCCAGYAATLVAGYSEAQAIKGCENDFEEAGHRLEAGKREAVKLMQCPENRLAVERVVEELLRRRRLDGDHIEVLIDVADGKTTEEEYQQFLRFID